MTLMELKVYNGSLQNAYLLLAIIPIMNALVSLIFLVLEAPAKVMFTKFSKGTNICDIINCATFILFSVEEFRFHRLPNFVFKL